LQHVSRESERQEQVEAVELEVWGKKGMAALPFVSERNVKGRCGC
jgi:hypothetical protein